MLISCERFIIILFFLKQNDTIHKCMIINNMLRNTHNPFSNSITQEYRGKKKRKENEIIIGKRMEIIMIIIQTP